MSRYVLAASLVAVVTLAACSPAPSATSPTPPASPANPASPSVGPTAPPAAAPTPAPSVEPPAASPEPSAADFTPAEAYLLAGVLRGASDCAPAAGSENLPAKAIAGIECKSTDPGIARIGFYLFDTDADMLEAYMVRMNAEGVPLNSGTCRDGEHEGAYTPGQGLGPHRNGCFMNDEGFANYRATLPGHVYIGILGRGDDMGALEDFAWLGNQDQPGNPTLWGEPR